MTDKELLSYAAKAAGFNTIEWYDYGGDDWGVFTGEEDWNPLLCDGDALRLAAKCGINLEFVQDICAASIWCKQDRAVLVQEKLPDYRRAIVRAAASIGEQL